MEVRVGVGETSATVGTGGTATTGRVITVGGIITAGVGVGVIVGTIVGAITGAMTGGITGATTGAMTIGAASACAATGFARCCMPLIVPGGNPVEMSPDLSRDLRSRWLIRYW